MRMQQLAPRDGLRINSDELVMISVLGEVAPPVEKGTPWRIGFDGRPRSLPGTGGIVLNWRVGDPCVGIAGDHVEPAVSIRSEQRSLGTADGPNQALQTYACAGNEAVVVSGAARGARGVVTGKHGGVETVLVDFPVETMRRMAIGDRVQIWACGLGLRLVDFPDVAIWNCSPRFLARWGPKVLGGSIHARVTHRVPARVMGSGLGRNNVLRGDYDIQLSDPDMVRRYGLGSMRLGDVVAIVDADNRFGRSRLGGHVAIGMVIHGESTVAGHGPGVMSLMSGPASLVRAELCRNANIAAFLDIRPPEPARPALPLPMREALEQKARRRRVTDARMGAER